jgi:serine protease AprX
MLKSRPLHLSVRLALAVGTSLSLVAASLPGAALASSAKPWTPGHVDRDLQRQSDSNPSSSVRVIITRDGHDKGDDAVRRQGGTVISRLELANSVVADVPASRLKELAAERGVVRITADAPVYVQALPDPLSNVNLQTVYPYAVDAASQWNGNQRLRGTGVGVAVIDSGIRGAHPDFGGGSPWALSRVLQVLNGMTGNPRSGADDNGHGTFVSGIIAGRGWASASTFEATRYVGIAPDANLISIKVSDSTGMAHVSDVISAIEWATKNSKRHNIRVLNLSLVSSMAGSYTTDMLDAAVELAWLQGLVVVVANGNAGANARITSPANDPFIISVGATDDMATRSIADDRLATFSSYGPTADGIAKPDLVAPGRRLVSTLSSPTDPLAVQFPTRIVDGSYIKLSGTSASAPVVSGVVAQLLQARPELTPGQVKWLLTRTAAPIVGPGTGAGYPRVGAAVQYRGPLGNSNTNLVPNQYLAAAYAAKKGLAVWNSVSWDSVSWDSVSWDSVSWDSVSWDSVSWDSVAWLPAD